MEPIFAVDQPTVFGIVAAGCTLLGTAMAILSHISGRKKAAEDAARETHEALLAEQRRTEKLSKELRDLRVKYGEAEDE